MNYENIFSDVVPDPDLFFIPSLTLILRTDCRYININIAMEPCDYSNEMFDDGMVDTEAGVGRARTGPAAAAAPRPHAQVHLLSPTDKCKV